MTAALRLRAAIDDAEAGTGDLTISRKPGAQVGVRGDGKDGIERAEAIDDEGGRGGLELPAIGGGQSGGGGFGTGEMTIGDDAGEGLGIEETGGGVHARFGENLRTVAPNQKSSAGTGVPLDDVRGGHGVFAKEKVRPDVRTVVDLIYGKRGVAGGEANEGDEEGQKENSAIPAKQRVATRGHEDGDRQQLEVVAREEAPTHGDGSQRQHRPEGEAEALTFSAAQKKDARPGDEGGVKAGPI